MSSSGPIGATEPGPDGLQRQRSCVVATPSPGQPWRRTQHHLSASDANCAFDSDSCPDLGSGVFRAQWPGGRRRRPIAFAAIGRRRERRHPPRTGLRLQSPLAAPGALSPRATRAHLMLRELNSGRARSLRPPVRRAHETAVLENLDRFVQTRPVTSSDAPAPWVPRVFRGFSKPASNVVPFPVPENPDSKGDPTWAIADSNRGPLPCEGSALTN